MPAAHRVTEPARQASLDLTVDHSGRCDRADPPPIPPDGAVLPGLAPKVTRNGQPIGDRPPPLQRTAPCHGQPELGYVDGP
jgi:hypothetical protein